MGGPRPASESILVRIRTDAGLVGIGETQAWRRQGSVETLASLKEVIDKHLAPRLAGRSPFELNALMHDLDEAIYHSFYAKAAVGDALYDLQGKALGLPVHVLLGGPCRAWLRGCAVLTIKDDWGAIREEADAFWERGFVSFTVKVGLDLEADVRNVSELRKTFPGAIIRIDANASMQFDAALKLLERIKPYDIDAAEQLIALWDVEGMAELARRVDIPLMADECVSSDHDLMRVIQLRAARVVQTKVAKNGGIHHSRKLWTLTDAAGLRIYPGNHPSTSVATASVVQLAAAWPGELLDGPFAVGITGAFAADTVAEPLTMEGSRVLVPSGPGLGVTIDEAAVKAMRCDA
jgi:muconate cycloisomerase